MAHPDPEWLDTILITYLEGNTPSLDVGYDEPPENPNPAYPHLIVSPLAPFDISGPLSDVNEIHNLEWQVASVGRYAQEARGGIAAARDRMLATPGPDFSAAGYKKTGTVKIVPGPVLSSDIADKPPLWDAFETYRIMVTPA